MNFKQEKREVAEKTTTSPNFEFAINLILTFVIL